MQDEPTADELLSAVVRFMKNDLARHGTDGLHFHALVCANAIETARREVELSQSFAIQELSRLSALLGKQESLSNLNSEFCEDLRSGKLRTSDNRVREHLWLTAMEKLAIDQPNYSTYERALQGHITEHFSAEHLETSNAEARRARGGSVS